MIELSLYIIPNSNKTKHTMKPNLTSEAKITGLSHEGRGICKIEEKTTFVFGGLPEETVILTYKKRRNKFDEATVTEVIEASPLRIEPPCEFFGLCGGCSLQHMQHDFQLEHKQKTLLELLQHQASTQPQEILTPLTAAQLGYRRKARLSVNYVPKKEKVMVGFRERRGRYVADMDSCKVLHPNIGERIAAFSALFFDLENKPEVKQLEVAVTDTATAVIIRHMKPFCDSDLKQLSDFAKKHKLHLYLQPKGVDSIHLFYPKQQYDKLHYTLPEFNLIMEFHPSQFTQVNQEINEKMLSQAIRLLDLQPNDKVLDLFCGIGNFTLPCARTAAKVIGFEGAGDAVKQARLNAEINNIDNCEFFTEDLFTETDYHPILLQKFDKVILDPPRSGAQEVLKLLPKWQTNLIVYVSCNPATFARDTKSITEQGYKLAKTGIIDMFPHTQHVEVMALFQKS